jgi:hypothetical protein
MHKPKTFRPAHQARTAADYEQRRGSARERGYDAQWDRASYAFKCEHPLCLGCQAVGRITPATVVDHVEPHHGDMVMFWDQSMWQSSCKWHHDVVKKHLEWLFANGKISVGDLHLNSTTAMRVTKLMMPTPTE